MAAADEVYQMRIYESKPRGNAKKIVVHAFKKTSIYKEAHLAYLEEEMKKHDLHLISTDDFKCKDSSSNTLKIILELEEYSPCIGEIDRSKMDAMNFGEKTDFTIPHNATVRKAIIFDENEPHNAKLDSSQESKPGVEGEDTIEPVHQYMFMMLIAYSILYSSFTMRQPSFR